MATFTGGVRFVIPRGPVLTYVEGSLGAGYTAVGASEITDYATGDFRRTNRVTWRGAFSLLSGTMLRPGGSAVGYVFEAGIVTHAGAGSDTYVPIRIGVTFGGGGD